MYIIAVRQKISTRLCDIRYTVGYLNDYQIHLIKSTEQCKKYILETHDKIKEIQYLYIRSNNGFNIASNIEFTITFVIIFLVFV